MALPNKQTVENSRQNAMLSALGITLAAAVGLFLSYSHENLQLMFMMIILLVCFGVIIHSLFFMRENFKWAYGYAETVLGVCGLAFALQAFMHNISSWIPPVPWWTTGLFGIVTALYFIIRGMDNVLKGEIERKSRFGEALVIWFKNHEESDL